MKEYIDLSFDTRLNPTILEFIKTNISNQSQPVVSSLVLDEVQLKQHLVYNSKSDYLDGKSDLSEFPTDKKIAKTALCFV